MMQKKVCLLVSVFPEDIVERVCCWAEKAGASTDCSHMVLTEGSQVMTVVITRIQDGVVETLLLVAEGAKVYLSLQKRGRRHLFQKSFLQEVLELLQEVTIATV